MQEIREGLAANMAAIYGGTVQVSAYELEQPTPPTLHVLGIEQIVYDRAYARGMDEVTITVQGLGGPMAQGAQIKLDEWLAPTGSTSVKAAIESERTLGGKVMDTVVTGASNYRLFKLADQTVVRGVEWQIRVLNSGA
jgi:hypothetical protein